MKTEKWRHALLGLIVFFSGVPTLFAQSEPLFPTAVAGGEGGELIMSEKTLRRVAVYSADGKRCLRTYPLPEQPTGVAFDAGKIYVTTFEQRGTLEILQASDGRRLASVATGSGACSPVVHASAGKVYVCNQFLDEVVEVDLRKSRVARRVKVLREPRSAVMTADGRYLYVANFLPAQRADVDYVGACVSVIDLKNFRKVKDIRLTNGSNALRGICLSGNGKYVYVSHNLGRYTVPTSQLQQGWMNTSAFSIIDVARQEYLGTVLTDEPERGAAGIWGIACHNDQICITHSGTHEVSLINESAMLSKFLAYPDKSRLEYDLNFLYGLRRRVPLQGNGPRALCRVGERWVVPTYFADILNFVDIRSQQVEAVNLNPGRTESDIHKGEKYFNDASHCFQNWQSCNGCHPGDARTDGMNWDLMNDGVGNPKNCKSLLLSHVTPPSMISGIRETAEWAVRAGFKFIQFFDVSEADAVCVDAYLKSLRPVPSPWLVNGQLSEKAKAGKEVFDRLKCGNCHSGPYYTDRKMYRIGEDVEFEKGWDTPTLCEVWRTAPYLFDGRAATMREVFEVYRHGIEGKVSKKDIEALTEYVNSL